MNVAIINGQLYNVTLSMLVPAIFELTIRDVPTGGVCWPIAMQIMVIIPNCTGVNPAISAIGRRIGIIIIIVAEVVIKHPVIIRVIIIKVRAVTEPPGASIMRSPIIRGIFK